MIILISGIVIGVLITSISYDRGYKQCKKDWFWISDKINED